MGQTTNTLIKICGITREEDAESALLYGADAIGLVFYEGSPRLVNIEQAAHLSRFVSDRALKVGLFVNASAEFVRQVLASVPLNVLQFHGDESAEFCEQFQRPYWKALRVRSASDIVTALASYEKAAAVLLDAWHPTQYGGTGETFDWSVLDGLFDGSDDAASEARKLILAGGLNPENVAQAIKKVRPWGVDVSSGVEEAPGVKSAELIKQFIEEVRRV